MIGAAVRGVYTGGGATLSFDRRYSTLPGLNVLRITTDFVNNGADMILAYFDTFDPDQGAGRYGVYGTYNDVVNTASGTIGLARVSIGGSQDTFVAGSRDARATVAAGYPFSINNGSDLNEFFSFPFDGGGVFADAGVHIGLRTLIAGGQSISYTFELAFGLNPVDAQAAYSAATLVPEPDPLVLCVLGACFVFLMKPRRGGGLRRQEALSH